MNNREAVIILAKTLAEAKHIMIVTDEAVKSALLSASQYALFPDGKTEPIISVTSKDVYGRYSLSSEGKGNLEVLLSAVRDDAYHSRANYLFLSVSSCLASSDDLFTLKNTAFTTPVALISDAEKELLKTLVYRNVSNELKGAMETLKISSFISEYERYTKGEVFRKKWRNGDYYDGLSVEFCNFAFSLPKAEQNIEANKGILKNGMVNSVEITAKEYAIDIETFKAYFGVLSDEGKKKVIGIVKDQAQNEELNQWLFENGFVGGEFLKHIKLYFKKDPNEFAHYFKECSADQKRKVLNDIFGLKESNPAIGKWLSENYPNLVNEIGRELVAAKAAEGEEKS